MKEYLTGEEAARMLGITRRTLYRWAEYMRIPGPDQWTRDGLAPYVGLPPLPKGPPRRPSSARYTIYRHRFLEVRGAGMHIAPEPTWEDYQ